MAELSQELPVYCSFLKHLCCEMPFVSVKGMEQSDLGPQCQAQKGPCTSLDPCGPSCSLARFAGADPKQSRGRLGGGSPDTEMQRARPEGRRCSGCILPITLSYKN